MISVFGSAAPLISFAFFRLTVPTIGLTGVNSLDTPVSKSPERAKACCTA